MPVLVNLDCDDHHLVTRNNGIEALLGKQSTTDCINIGLINNMPDSALVSTERQLFDLLSAAAGKRVVRLHLYTMDATPRSDWGRDYTSRFYLRMNDLFNDSLDGVIVTGAEPRATNLSEEPYWHSFRQFLDWAKENTVSSICSCLAVHGAVLHMDGVERHPLSEKCIGVFAQRVLTDHPLMRDVPSSFGIPHSRWNEVRGAALGKSGYTILTNSSEAGVDTFVKQHQKSLFVHFQGHPEYEAQTLLGEYRRDIGRFLRGENAVYPTMPKGYFSGDAEDKLMAFRGEALLSRRPEIFADFPVDQLTQDLRNTWRPVATCIYRNWITYISSRKVRRTKSLTISNPV